MKIIALKDYTDNKISLYEGQIRQVSNKLATQLIAKKVVGTSFPDDISITPSSTTGTQIADIKINGQSNKIYAPSGEGSGSNNTFIVNITVSHIGPQEQYTQFDSDKTYKEISDAFLNGQYVYAFMQEGDDSSYGILAMISTSTDIYSVMFSNIMYPLSCSSQNEYPSQTMT